MVEHKIYEGISSTFKKEETLRHFLPSSGADRALNYLLSTPQIIEMIIEASATMLDPLLPREYITVGTHIELSHEQPTLVLAGGTITVKLTVVKIHGNRINLDIECYDENGLICKGKYERAIVNKEKLRVTSYKRAQGIV
mgnify:CR=1 FL=1